jgi:hypothetical protein
VKRARTRGDGAGHGAGDGTWGRAMEAAGKAGGGNCGRGGEGFGLVGVSCSWQAGPGPNV